MFDKLEDLLIRFEEIMGELHEPTVTNNQERFRKLMKEQSDLTPIVDAYTEYKKCKQDIEDSLSMLEEEKDEEMREMIKETFNDSKTRVEELVRDYITEENGDPETFGNARGVRNIFEHILVAQNNRLAAMETVTKEDLMPLTQDDVLHARGKLD